MILIDALYINSFGGKTILELLGEKILNKGVKYHFIFDSRLNSNLIQKIKSNDFTFVKASHKKRKEFYLSRINNFSHILCLSNVPPPILTTVKTTIFFHNSLFLNPLSNPISFKSRIINFFKFNYIKYYSQNDYHWIVQTQLIKKLLQENLNINLDQISIYPVFKGVSESHITKKHTNNFVYISSSVFHKNHIRLIKAFIYAANKTVKEINLHLTVDKEQLPKYVFPKNLNVQFHGTLSKDYVNELYNSCEFAIYPSLVESFGLPLIEATHHGCKVIASDLPYVHEIVKPSLIFDPYSVKSISKSILKALESENLPKTKVLIENKLNNFIELIIRQDVQK